MRSFPPWLRSLARSLAVRLDRLRVTLDGLRTRVRQSVTQAVGEVVAGAVQDALRVALAVPPVVTAPALPPPRRYGTGGAFWDRPDAHDDDSALPWNNPRHERLDDPEDDLSEDDLPADDFDDVPYDPGHVTEAPATQSAPQWPEAAAIGCQAAAWWLRRQGGRLPLLALGVGLAAGLATFTGAGLVTSGVGALASALGLTSLAPTALSFITAAMR